MTTNPSNPLVASRIEAPKDNLAGVWLAEDLDLIAQGIRNGSWIDGTLGVVGAGLDALALVSDPVGTLLQYGISWFIEHVKPLSEALDWLAGDPAQIAAHANTWRNIAQALQSSTGDLAHATTTDLGDWHGAAAAAYRTWSAEQRAAVEGLFKAAELMSVVTEAAGALIAAVRLMVRDAIATVVSRLAVYAAELLGSLGAAASLVAEQVTALCASWAAKIARWLRAPINSLRRLLPVLRRAGEIAQEIKWILSRLRGRRPQRPGPTEPPKKISGPKDFDPQELRGLTPDEVRARIPDDWVHDSSARGGGEVFRDPVNKGRQIRIMPGYPPGSRPDPLTWGPYVVVSQNGLPPVKIPLAGNPNLP